eukprot:SAG11_NODE_31731_length_289_cov_1.557895_1_plen_51_part_10
MYAIFIDPVHTKFSSYHGKVLVPKFSKYHIFLYSLGLVLKIVDLPFQNFSS